MQPKEVRTSRAKVNKAFQVYLTVPNLTLAFHKALARIYERAEVHLNRAEKAMLLRKIAAAFNRGIPRIHPQ